MNRQEREKSRIAREKLRRRRLWIAKRLVGCAVVLTAAILVISFFGKLFSSGEDPAVPALARMDSGPEGTSAGGISVNWSSSEDQTTPEPVPTEPAGYQQLADPLLVLVNKEVPLPEDWQVNLVNVTQDSDIQVDSRIYDDFCDMWRAASADGAVLWVASGYRSVELQQEVLDEAIRSRVSQNGMTEEEAREDALRTIQQPGHSEHHTGLAVDFNDVNDGFEETEAYAWLSQHAADYGFVQRYSQNKVDKTGIDNESWHYRYVGKEHAKEMERLGMCLEEYVEYLH